MNAQHVVRPQEESVQHDLELDIPFGSLDAAAMAELPYTFNQSGTCTRYYNEFFG
ncbi:MULTISPECIES: hypothetical protein [unclassified Cupriavidus]|uniref:hypothetical protein n=1 Tax=Cupriavidus sp. H19C3 TaxID=3241603 RepID=UPI003BF8F163